MQQDRRPDLREPPKPSEQRRTADLPWPVVEPRRLLIGDLITFVVVAALASSALSSLTGSTLNSGHRLGFVALTFLHFSLLVSLWHLPSVSPGQTDDSTRLLVAIALLVLLPLSFACIAVLALLSPEGTLPLVLLTILLLIYATTWD